MGDIPEREEIRTVSVKGGIMNIGEKLMAIQNELVAPKNLYNDFGKYSYRSCESILEAVKPILKKHGCYMVITDDIIEIGGRFYVQAIATIYDTESSEKISTSAMAREQDSKKGMDESQITGATSSYARKYALNGLFLIDDNKDADTNEQRIERDCRAESRARQEDPLIGGDEYRRLTMMAEDAGVSIDYLCQHYKIGSLQEMTMSQWSNACKKLDATMKNTGKTK